MKILTASGIVITFTKREFEILKLAIEFAQDCWADELREQGKFSKNTKYSRRVADTNLMCKQLFKFDDNK